MRAQLMEFTAARRCSARKGASLNMPFTKSWQSSKSPRTAKLRMLGESTVVICRRCTSLVRPSGWRITTSSAWRSRQASMAAEPVSPLVAPTIVTRSPRRARAWSNSRPRSCIATSLKAKVGPWNSSNAKVRWSSCASGTTAGWLKRA